MKNRAKHIFCLLFMALTLVATTVGCSPETEDVRSGSALLVPVVTIDPTVYTASGPAETDVLENQPLPEEMALRVSNSAGQYAATWPSLAEYPLREPYRPGIYVVEAFSPGDVEEGFERPYFYGVAPVVMQSGETARVEVKCTLANAVFDLLFSDRFNSAFTNPVGTVHSQGGGYFRFPAEENRRAYLRGGPTAIYLSLTLPSGESADFLACEIEDAEMQHLYTASFDADVTSQPYPVITISFDGTTTADDVEIALTPEFLASAAPEMTPTGFNPGEPISLTEGDTPQSPVGVTLSGAPAESLILTVSANSITSRGWPQEIDLAKASAAEIRDLEDLGLKITRTAGKITAVDLTDALGLLRSYDPKATFSFLATSAAGKIAGPLTLDVDVKPAELNVVSVSDAVVGLDLVQVKLLSSASELADNIAFETLAPGETYWQTAEVVSIEESASKPGEWTAIVKVANNDKQSADLRIVYCGNEVDRRKIEFVAPKSENSVDAYACSAAILVSTDNQDMLEMIVSRSDVYVNGTQWQLVGRRPESGLIIVFGLTPSTRYEIKTTLFDDPGTSAELFSNTVVIETERARQLPNGSFEDVKDGVNYDNLPSGGRYSQNIVDIYNQQNYMSFSGYVPKDWANVNVKTFCRQAKNYNTWYMYPSAATVTDAMDGAYAVCLRTVSFDLDGPAIPDYRQTSTPYVNYSRNIPSIRYKAAGKLFLGEYGFNPATMEEAYIEGIEFRSRPSSLNGYYRFIPSLADISDCGVVQVEVIGTVDNADIVIARATARLTAASGYTAFSVPLSYTHFGVKATRVKVMVASSESPGSIAHETATILTEPDPVTATSHGGTLWIDNLTFSY